MTDILALVVLTQDVREFSFLQLTTTDILFVVAVAQYVREFDFLHPI